MSNNNEALNYPYNQTTLSQSVNNHVSGSAIETQYIGVFDKYNQIVSYGYSNKIDARSKVFMWIIIHFRKWSISEVANHSFRFNILYYKQWSC